MDRLRLLILVAITSCALAGSSFAQQKPAPVPVPENDPLYMRVVAMPYPPEAQILDGNGHRHSAYELYVTNWGKTPLKITKLDVSGVVPRAGRAHANELAYARGTGRKFGWGSHAVLVGNTGWFTATAVRRVSNDNA